MRKSGAEGGADWEVRVTTGWEAGATPGSRGTGMAWGAYPCGMGDSSLQRVWVRRPRSMWRLIPGWFCIALGIVGILVPILPGIPLLIVGLVLLSTQYHWAHRGMVWMKARFHRKPAHR